MKEHKKRYILFVIIVICCSGIGIGAYYLSRPKVLTIGFPAGSYWNVPNGNSYAVLDAAVEKFEKKHPEVKVEFEEGIMQRDYNGWLSNEILKGVAPDVYIVLPDEFENLTDLGALKSLDKLIEQDREFDISRYYASSVEAGKTHGIQYSLPYESVPTLMFVNQTLLEKNGIQMPEKSWSWKEFYDICSQLTKDTDGDGKNDQFGCYGYTWQDSLLSNGCNIFSEDGKSCDLNSRKVEEAIRFVCRIQELNNGVEVTEKDFDLGRVAFRPMLFSEYRTYQPYPWRIKKYSSFRWNCIPMPAGASGQNISELSTLQAGMNARTKKEKLAWEFLKILTYDEEIQKRIYSDSQGCSALITVTESEEVQKELNKNIYEEGNNLDFGLLSDIMKKTVTASKFRGQNEAYILADNLVLKAMKNPDNLKVGLAYAQLQVMQYLRK